MNNENRSVGSVVQELKVELRDFVTTRVAILKAEITEKKSVLKAAVPLLAGAAFCALACFVAVNFAVLAFLRGLFNGTYAWCYAALILAGFYLIAAAGLFWFGRRELASTKMAPERTLQVLKQDQAWLQSEVRHA